MRLLVAALIALPACGKRSSEPAPEGTPAAAGDAAAVDRRPERIVLTRVTVGIIHAEGKPPTPMPQAAAPLTTSLAMTGWFAGDASSVPASHRPRPAHLDVVVAATALEDRAHHGWSVVAGAEAVITWEDRGQDPAPHDKVIIERATGRSRPTPQQVEEVAAAAAMTVTRGLTADEEIRSGPPDKLRAALAGEDDDQRLWALALIRERRPADLVEPVARLLAAEDLDVRERALGALLAIGDPRAAGAIADHARTDDLPFLRNAIDAVAALGGQDAIDWLEFLASGHSDEQIRAQAARALDKVKARQPAPP